MADDDYQGQHPLLSHAGEDAAWDQVGVKMKPCLFASELLPSLGCTPDARWCGRRSCTFLPMTPAPFLCQG